MHVRKNALDHADACKFCQLYSTCAVLTITSYRIMLQHILIGGASMKRRGGKGGEGKTCRGETKEAKKRGGEKRGQGGKKHTPWKIKPTIFHAQGSYH